MYQHIGVCHQLSISPTGLRDNSGTASSVVQERRTAICRERQKASGRAKIFFVMSFPPVIEKPSFSKPHTVDRCGS